MPSFPSSSQPCESWCGVSTKLCKWQPLACTRFMLPCCGSATTCPAPTSSSRAHCSGPALVTPALLRMTSPEAPCLRRAQSSGAALTVSGGGMQTGFNILEVTVFGALKSGSLQSDVMQVAVVDSIFFVVRCCLAIWLQCILF